MAITNKSQFRQGMNVETWLDDYFRNRGWDIKRTTPYQERVLCLGDRQFSKLGVRYWIEYKSGIQTFYTGNIFLETISVDTAGVPGWLYTCQADYLMYAALLNGKILVFEPEVLRQKEPMLRERCPEVATCHDQNDGYRTHGLLVKLNFAEKHLAKQILNIAA